jgi:hypothetical protein
MKKASLIFCVAAALALGAVAANTRAQKQTDAPDSRHVEMKHEDGMKHEGGDGMNHADCPVMHDKSSGEMKGHDAHSDGVEARGAMTMGFSQTATTHHFTLTRDGGAIQVEVNDAKDAENRDAVRRHLAHIARLFAEGDFNTPMLVHERVPPGVPVMQRLKSEIRYDYEETNAGARVRITTKSAEALAAVHDFLRFQITDHRTGDSLEVNNR